MRTVALVGNPNVGKSVLFYQLTGNYVTVSNYPGTTVEVSRGTANFFGRIYQVYDTPGMYSLSPLTEEEAVTRRLMMEVPPDVIVHVADAKNLPRMLPLTLELLELGRPVILVLNMMDEAEKLGVGVQRAQLAARLGVPVLEAAFAKGRGINSLRREIAALTAKKSISPSPLPPGHSQAQRAAAHLQSSYPLPAVVTARLFLEDDKEICALVRKRESHASQEALSRIKEQAGNRAAYVLALQRRQAAQKLLAGVYTEGREADGGSLAERLTLDPLGGFLLMVLVLYAGLYLFVGRFGAGTLVDLLEGALFSDMLLPYVVPQVKHYLPWPPLQELLAGEFGIITMGFRYAFGIILPIVGTFFFMFAVLEDSGYLPRLAFWADGWMARVGLNGRAVIPLTLGLGCGTMAVLVTRTLESKRERVIATFLLALAVPCSAQLGLIVSLLAKKPQYLFVWFVVVGGLFLVAGRLLHILIPGSRAPFFMELPPLRMPKLNAIFQKTLARMKWYFAEVIPVFIAVSTFLWLLGEAGLLAGLAALLAPLLGRMGLPPAAGQVFLYGFFRRDYGAAGLFDLYRAGTVSDGQLLIASVVLTLFLPCLAQLAVMIRERGLPVAISVAVAVFVLAFAVGIALRSILGLPTM